MCSVKPGAEKLLSMRKGSEQVWSRCEWEITTSFTRTCSRSVSAPDTKPATHLNADILARYREQMRPFYYDPSKYPTYLDQLGIKYPTVRTAP